MTHTFNLGKAYPGVERGGEGVQEGVGQDKHAWVVFN